MCFRMGTSFNFHYKKRRKWPSICFPLFHLCPWKRIFCWPKTTTVSFIRNSISLLLFIPFWDTNIYIFFITCRHYLFIVLIAAFSLVFDLLRDSCISPWTQWHFPNRLTPCLWKHLRTLLLQNAKQFMQNAASFWIQYLNNEIFLGGVSTSICCKKYNI